MEAVGAASAIASLVVLGGKVSIEAHGFFGRMKDCPARVQSFGDDLDSTTSILRQLELALSNPAHTGLFSLQGKEDQFKSSMKGLKDVFLELSALINKYEGLSKKRWSWTLLKKSSKWAATGQTEALQLSGSLSIHKQSLMITLQLAHG